MRSVVGALGLFALLLCAGRAEAEAPPKIDRVEELGTFERAALDRALKKRGLEVDPAPAGKTLRKIHVVNLPVFTERAGFLQWFNIFHVTTREYVIRREVLLRPGDRWDERVVAETQRTLADPLFSALVVVVPVIVPGSTTDVDLLVVTRDVWSLRTNTDFEIQAGTVTRFVLSPSEQNLLGLRKTLSFTFDMNQGNFSIGPQYLDKNLAGTRLQLGGSARLIFSRAEREPEGTSASVTLSMPLYSLRRKWGASLSVSHFNSRVRLFRGTGLRPYDNPDTLEIEAIPWQYDQRNFDFDTAFVRSFGYKIKQNISFGHDFDLVRPSVIDGFPYGALSNPTRERVQIAREAFIRDALPRSERSSSLFLTYRFFVADFVVYRDLQTYSLAENVRLGPDLTVSASTALKAIGSQRDFSLGSISAGWTFDIRGDGFFRLAASAATRLQGGEFIDNVVSGGFSLATPRIGNLIRPVFRASLAGRINEQANRFFTLGGDNGLRGYAIGEFAGQVRAIGNVELRTRSIDFLFSKLGLLAFYDIGHAADHVSDLSPRHNIGIGLRGLVPEAQPAVFRIDLAFPLRDRSAWPPRFTAGLGQTF